MNKEAKVGSLVIVFLIIVLGFIVWIKGNPFRETKTLHVLFDSVHGLSIGSPVEYAGYHCGKVHDFQVTTGGIVSQILITEPKVRIHQGDKFLIIPSSTIASEYQIFIVPNSSPSPEIPNESTIIGQSAPGMQDFLFSAEEALSDLKIVMRQVKGILTELDESVNEVSPLFHKVGEIAQDGTIDNFIDNLNNSAQSISQVSGTANEILQEKSDTIKITIDKISSLANQADEKFEAIDSEDLRETIKSLRNTAKNLESISGVIEPEEFKEQLKTFADAAEQAENIMKKLQSDDPDKDAPTIIKRNLQRLDRISAGLEKSLKNRKLIKVLFTKVPISDASEDNNSAAYSKEKSNDYSRSAFSRNKKEN
ncbi:MAG: MlaD family protein [Candidatus Caenarcaniphilales bacterium]|nr:MlaD family protein [Candidatus Caenarcaniphilales bacterium]